MINNQQWEGAQYIPEKKKDSVARCRDQEKGWYNKRPKGERPDHRRIQIILGF